jgi:hypothetical protein
MPIDRKAFMTYMLQQARSYIDKYNTDNESQVEISDEVEVVDGTRPVEREEDKHWEFFIDGGDVHGAFVVGTDDL